MKIYQVGGAVRDKILNIPSQDIDYLITGSSIDEMLSLGYIQVGKNFPVFINPQNKCEYALARKEIKTGPKHTDFKFIFTPNITLEEDSLRRDFTCNALIFDPETQQIMDFHNGIQDIKNKIIRHINSEHFIEDPLRVLRMCRFSAQLDFDIAAETMTLARQMVDKQMLKHLSPDRIWQEISKALQTPHFDKFILSAKECGALRQILPEIDQLFSIPENPHTHPEKTVGNHTILALQYAANFAPITKFAILTHDVGKLKTPTNEYPKHHNHHINGVDIINQICARLKIPNSFKKFATLCCKYHTHFAEIENISFENLADITDAFIKTDTAEFINVCKADFYGRNIKYSDELFEKRKQIFDKSINIIKKITPDNIPDFATTPKDKSFGNILKQHKITLLQNNFPLKKDILHLKK